MKNQYLIVVLIAFFLISGCGKKSDTTTQKEEKSTEQTNQKSADEQKKEDSMKNVNAQLEKEKKVKEALEEEKLLNDTNGQWAISAEASSTYAKDNPDKNANFSPNQMTGKPDCENYGDNGKAWAPEEADKGVEWVQLTYAKAVNAFEVRIRQNVGPGAIIKIELIDDKGKLHTVWEGVDKTKYEENKIQWLIAKFNKTDYKTKVIKITLATNSVPGWNEIDAVQLVGN